MSEKELRDRVIESNMYADICVLCGSSSTQGAQAIEHLGECPLSADPDLVVFAKQLLRMHTTRGDSGTWVIISEATLRKTLERDFGLRLTDGGWEWVEGEG